MLVSLRVEEIHGKKCCVERADRRTSRVVRKKNNTRVRRRLAITRMMC